MSNHFINLRDEVKNLISATAPAYYMHAPVDATYPYAEYEIRRTTWTGGVDKYVLEINLWDKGNTSSRISSFMDDIEFNLNGFIKNDSYKTCIIHKGQRQELADTDKNIKRIRSLLDLTVIERR